MYLIAMLRTWDHNNGNFQRLAALSSSSFPPALPQRGTTGLVLE